METFNNTSIFTGYLKQLLHDFNLPRLKVYTKKLEKYKLEHGTESPEIFETITEKTNSGEISEIIRYVPYIRGGLIQEYINGKWQDVGNNKNRSHQHFYTYGTKIPNVTKNLEIQDNIYDSYTHEYLGDYLRFQRDYCNIDLMPLYNCFSNRECPRLNLSLGDNVIFNTKDKNYKIYMVPVRLFNQYTFAIDSEQPIEICCGIYGHYQNTETKYTDLPFVTYKKIKKSYFSSPEILNILTVENLSRLKKSTLAEILQVENDLKLFIKVPSLNTSTIVLLEGNYSGWNDEIYNKVSTETFTISSYANADNPYFSAPSAEGQYALAVDKQKFIINKDNIENVPTGPELYISIKKENEENKFEWQFYRPVFLNGTTKTIGGTDFNSNRIIEDNINYTNDNRYPQFMGISSDKYFECYCKVKNEKVNSNTAYFNTKSMKLNINYFSKLTKQINHSVINLSEEVMEEDFDEPFISPLQLLIFNTQEQHPFADRLIEYLLENVITSAEDEIPDNVRRVQKVMELNSRSNNYSMIVPGEWDKNMSRVAYEYITTHRNNFEENHDILGFIDKDVEKYYKNVSFDVKGNKIITSLLNVDLDPEDL